MTGRLGHRGTGDRDLRATVALTDLRPDYRRGGLRRPARTRLREHIGAVIAGRDGVGGCERLSVARAVIGPCRNFGGIPGTGRNGGAAVGGVAERGLTIAGRRRPGRVRALLTGSPPGMVWAARTRDPGVSVREAGQRAQGDPAATAGRPTAGAGRGASSRCG